MDTDKTADSHGQQVNGGEKCSMRSVKEYLHYDMTQLGSFVRLLEFDLRERYYRYSKSHYGGHRAKVIENIRVMVFIPF